jgi:succinate-semialdehyde dehydrogenase / glutarate-semialdehyde dehydrogenase
MFDVLQSETGKSRRDAFVEMFAVACEARYYAYNGGRYLKSRQVKSAIPLRDRTTVHYKPVGVVGVISPWNFPFILSVGDAIPALLAGNGVVLKPASLTPLTAIWARDRLVEAGLPPALFEVVTGPGSSIANALIDSVDYVMFTGSTEIGRKVAERAATRLIGCSMELGGKNAVVVLPDADPKHAVDVTIEGTFNNAGQVCINFERAYVHRDIYDRYVDALKRSTVLCRVGSHSDFSDDIGSLISPDQLETVEAHVQDAVSKGAQVVVGGNRRSDLGPLFYEPTILAGVTPDMTVYAEETFGPVLSVYKVDSVDDAVHLANNSSYGLHYGVLGQNRRRAEQVAKRLEAGSVAVNDSYMVWGAMDAPMGGIKQSGVGRRHGPEGIRKYCDVQTIVTNRTPWQIGSYETALSINKRLADALVILLRIWRHVPFIR